MFACTAAKKVFAMSSLYPQTQVSNVDRALNHHVKLPFLQYLPTVDLDDHNIWLCTQCMTYMSALTNHKWVTLGGGIAVKPER